ncbi:MULTISPECIES: hypothetical protein [Catenuloplanes]|uniref:Lipoprotein n=1 Tax=Catenuloplanes niger TaxID=587534 RepID=A0AAE3ZM43_9ACTN|nr:hypothetical protein [Catenuloplanes niger]MDR7320663.1 hypothetical protein [Catenuloplanes niger]
MRKSIAALAVSFTLAGCAGEAAERTAPSPSPTADAKAAVVAAFAPLTSGTPMYTITYEQLGAVVRVQRDHAADATFTTLSITVTDDDRAMAFQTYRVGEDVFSRLDVSQLPPGTVPEDRQISTWVRTGPERPARITTGTDQLAVTPDEVAAAILTAQQQTPSRISGTVDLTAIVPERFDTPEARTATFGAELYGDGSIAYFTVNLRAKGQTTRPFQFRGLGQATDTLPAVPKSGQYREAQPSFYTMELPLD